MSLNKKLSIKLRNFKEWNDNVACMVWIRLSTCLCLLNTLISLAYLQIQQKKTQGQKPPILAQFRPKILELHGDLELDLEIRGLLLTYGPNQQSKRIKPIGYLHVFKRKRKC